MMSWGLVRLSTTRTQQRPTVYGSCSDRDFSPSVSFHRYMAAWTLIFSCHSFGAGIFSFVVRIGPSKRLRGCASHGRRHPRHTDLGSAQRAM